MYTQVSRVGVTFVIWESESCEASHATARKTAQVPSSMRAYTLPMGLASIKRLVGGSVIADSGKADAVKGMPFVGQPEIRQGP